MELTPEEIQLAPDTPGVYIFYDKQGEVIYVGKSKALRKRLLSHFQQTNRSVKSKAIQTLCHKIRLIQTNTEAEALLLEYNLIQKYKPKLNVQYKDQKSYPYLKITLNERYPRVQIIREEKQPGSIYLGPFPNVKQVRRSLKLALRLFPIADCNHEIRTGDYKKWAKTCIRRQIGTCLAPCQYEVPKNEYDKLVKQLIQFFSGEINNLISEMEREMWDLSEKLEFEKAAKIRDNIDALKNISQKQRIFLSKNISAAIIAETKKNNIYSISGFFVEQGRIIDSFELHFKKEKNNDMDPLAFLLERLSNPPGNIVVVGEDNEMTVKVEKKLLEQGIEVKKPSTAEELELYHFALNTAKLSLSKYFVSISEKNKQKEDKDIRIKDLEQLLNIDSIKVIHCFDVSTLYGEQNVASCVVFENGKSIKEKYRRFKSKLQGKQDDYYVMREAIRRYYEKHSLPDVIVIDGGLGQVRAAKEAINYLEMTSGFKRKKKNYVLIGLAKKEEIIVFPDGKELKENKNRPAVLLLREIRDEAHRFAVSYNRKLREIHVYDSLIDNIEGIGSKRKKALLKEYPDLFSILNEDPIIVSKKTKIPLKIINNLIDSLKEKREFE